MMGKKKTAPVMDPMNGEKLQAQQLAELDYAHQAASIAAGEEEKTYGIWGKIWHFLRYLDGLRGQHTCRKKTYIILLLLTGWMGGHRYYQGRWRLGILYTLLCWTGIPIALSVTDFMEVVPIQANADGMIKL